MAKRPEGFENVVVKRSPVHGKGLFAARDFKRGERIIEYVGKKVSKKEGERRAERQWKKGRVYVFDLNKKYDIDGAPKWNKARFANHSCDPNAESENERGRRIWVVARRRIRAGDELSYDYNFPMDDDPAECHCGSKKCRGYLVGSDYAKELAAWKRKRR